MLDVLGVPQQQRQLVVDGALLVLAPVVGRVRPAADSIEDVGQRVGAQGGLDLAAALVVELGAVLAGGLPPGIEDGGDGVVWSSLLDDGVLS